MKRTVKEAIFQCMETPKNLGAVRGCNILQSMKFQVPCKPDHKQDTKTTVGDFHCTETPNTLGTAGGPNLPTVVTLPTNYEKSMKFACKPDHDQGTPDSSMPLYVGKTNDTQYEITKYIDYSTIQHVRRSKDENKMICNLMTALFTLEEMAKSLVTGKRIKKEDEERELLDQEKIHAIVQFVQGIYPHMTETYIRSKMANKCKDTRHAIRRLKEKELLSNMNIA